jgi:hypothetical protein
LASSCSSSAWKPRSLALHAGTGACGLLEEQVDVNRGAFSGASAKSARFTKVTDVPSETLVANPLQSTIDGSPGGEPVSQELEALGGDGHPLRPAGHQLLTLEEADPAVKAATVEQLRKAARNAAKAAVQPGDGHPGAAAAADHHQDGNLRLPKTRIHGLERLGDAQAGHGPGLHFSMAPPPALARIRVFGDGNQRYHRKEE